MREKCPYLTCLATDCLKDNPVDRPNADMVFSQINDWWHQPKMRENCSESLLQHSELDKVSLFASLDTQATKAEGLVSAVKQYQTQVYELTTTTSSKEQQISNLVQNNADQLISLQSQESEIDQLKSQCKKLSLQSSSEIVMNLSSMLRQEQEDMKEKQKEIKNLKMELNNSEHTYAMLKKKSEEKEQYLQQENSQLKLRLKKKETELIQNIEVISKEKESIAHEKEELHLQLQRYNVDLQNRQKEVEELKAELVKANMTLESDKQSAYKKSMEQSSSNELNRNQDIVQDKQREFLDQIQNMSASVQKMQKENEELKYKLKQGEEMYQKLTEETEQNIKEKLKAKAESATSVDVDVRALEAEKHRLDQENEQLKQQVLQANESSNYHLFNKLNKNVKEIQVANERCVHREKQIHQCIATIEKQKKEISELSVVKSTTRQQLDEKSVRISSLLSQLNTCQQKLDVKDTQLGKIQSENVTLQKLLDNVSKLHTDSQRELKDHKAAHREAKISKEVYTDGNERLQVDLQKCQDMIEKKEKEVTLLNETLQKCHEVILQHQEKTKDLEKQNKRLSLSHSKSSRQLESKLKDKSKYIESLERTVSSGHSRHYCYSLHWSAYLSLPARRIKPSAAVVKDKVFVTGGYQEVYPQGENLDSCLKPLERGNEVFCFYTTKCRCDSIASPVVLGGVASVNGQCVLVSGTEGNTLTGNVYVLCEEGSDEQWKKFSEPVPTPRILPCVCCYGERWMIVCGGYACKEGSNLLEAVNVVEILDTTKGEWYTLPETGSPNLSAVLDCGIVGDDMYIIGDDKVLRSSCKKLVSVVTMKPDDIVWSEVQVVAAEVDKDLHPFSVVEVAGKPMITASFSDSEDDMTCVLLKDTTDTWRKMSEAVECQHCSAVVVTPTLELLLIGGSRNIQLAEGTDICQNGTLVPTLNEWGKC